MQFELLEEGEDTFFVGGGNDRMRAKVFSFSSFHVTGRLPSLPPCMTVLLATGVVVVPPCRKRRRRGRCTQFLCGGHILTRVLLAAL